MTKDEILLLYILTNEITKRKGDNKLYARDDIELNGQSTIIAAY